MARYKTDIPSLRDRLIEACQDECDCGVSSAAVRDHDLRCHYRLFAEAIAEIDWLQSSEGKADG